MIKINHILKKLLFIIKIKNLKFEENWQISFLYPFIFTILFVIILFQYQITSWESVFYGLRIKYDFGIKSYSNIVLITLDEESDQYLGESFPYSLNSHIKLLKKLRTESPNSITYLLRLNNEIEQSSNKDVIKFKHIISQLTKKTYFAFGTGMYYLDENLIREDVNNFNYQYAILNIDHSTFAKDDVTRKAILNISGENTLHLKLANHFRKTQGLKVIQPRDVKGSFYENKPDATFYYYRFSEDPTAPKGTSKIKSISFYNVIAGLYPNDFFKNKIILIGSSYFSKSQDYIKTPFDTKNKTTSKLKAHAEIIESLIQNKSIKKLPLSLSYSLALIIAICMSIFISRINPLKGLLLTGVLITSVFLFGFIAFSFGYWIYLSHIILTIFIVYYIWIPFRAIAEYQRRFAIQEENKLIQHVENLKRNFISLMSHDLKTPVAKIAGLADISLKYHNVPELIRNNLRSISDSTQELNKFITSILDLLKIESRNLSLDLKSKDINIIIQDIATKLQFEANQKNILISMELSPLYPITIDINLINRVLANLIENAIKYSGENTNIKIETYDDDQWVYVKISDNGVGINRSELQNIFNKFYRVQNDANHKIKGSGLGLYLVKYFVELHGGNISVSSIQNSGTIFLIKLKNE